MKNLLIPVTDYQLLVQSIVMSIQMSNTDNPDLYAWAKTALDAYLKDSDQMDGLVADIEAQLTGEPAPKPVAKATPTKKS